MRIDKFLCNALALSRKEVQKIIKQKKVLVNNEIINKVDFKIDENNDEIYYNNQKLKYREFIYVMMNKPSGIISATYDKFDKTVIDLLDSKLKYYNLFPVGRLDKDTVGLLLLTNDGKLSHDLLSPKKHIDKKYLVKSLNNLSLEDINKLENGIDIGDYITKKSKIEIIKENEFYITISEGKFHQIKRMLEAINNKVIFLERVEFKNLKLDKKLARGEYRELTELEIEALINR